MRKLLIVSIAILAGCVSTPQGYWFKGSMRVDADPQVFAQFQRDRAVCDGEAAQAALASNERLRAEHNRLVNLVFDGCLTKRGYVRKPG